MSERPPGDRPSAHDLAATLELPGRGAATAAAITGASGLGGAYPVSRFAAAAVGAAALAVADLTGAPAQATVSMPLVDAWFSAAVRLRTAQPSPWDAIAGDYRAADGWVRLHTNAPAHKAAALAVLELDASSDRAAVAAAVRAVRADDLETAVVAAGGCAAVMRTPGDWQRHPQGIALAAEPLIAVASGEKPATARPMPRGSTHRPLAGLRVLDLTRVLAGPVATRTLALLGAEVLRVDPPAWNEPVLEPDMTLGKRCARLDARSSEGRAALLDLLRGADVLVHGYRPGALDSIGLDAATRAEVRPGLVEVQISAYGYSGPWAARRGFDSLVQMSTGIADRGMRESGAESPVPLPVQALDHATGWLAAAAALRGVAVARRDGHGSASRLSLARTALELERWREALGGGPFASEPSDELPSRPIDTPWGIVDLIDSPLDLSDAALAAVLPPRPLGSDAPAWGI
ncbi:CoA transferase [Microcella sp.]|uniref:CoA transferase n=1 Tax=Microcella sp. TaxID=1913979 RepID=UPI00391C5783